MKLTNTSRYADAEVARLVAFAMRDVDHARLAVHVKNTARAYRGRAYESVPGISSNARDPEVDRLVTIGIGAPALFPCDNVQTRVRWVPLRAAETNPRSAVRTRRDRGGRARLERRVVERHGYGGKRSPILVFGDWREALVAVAAHEGRHIWQYQHGRPRSEVDAEQFAAGRLKEYRAGVAAPGG